jgi:polygalacturonase
MLVLLQPFLLVLAAAAAVAPASSGNPAASGAAAAEKLAVPPLYQAPLLQAFHWVDAAGARRLGGRSPKVCSITAYGAVPGSTNSTHAGPSSTRAIQAAIDDCGSSPLGGTVVVPAGQTFVTGSLFLRSDITLHIGRNATLLGATALDAWRTDGSLHPEYPWVYDRLDWWGMFRAGLINGPRCTAHPRCPTPVQGQSTPHCGPNLTFGDLCTARERLENVVITGEGTIDGNGRNPGARGGWWARPADSNRPLLVTPSFIDGLTIHGGLRIMDGANWQTHPMFCNHVWISNITVYSVGVPNGKSLCHRCCWLFCPGL